MGERERLAERLRALPDGLEGKAVMLDRLSAMTGDEVAFRHKMLDAADKFQAFLADAESAGLCVLVGVCGGPDSDPDRGLMETTAAGVNDFLRRVHPRLRATLTVEAEEA